MGKVTDFLNSPTGRWLVRATSVVVGALAQGGLIPVDYAIPGIGITIGQALIWAGVLIPSAARNTLVAAK